MNGFVPPGTLLAASPQLLDPNFMHAVVLICQHSEQGAFGLVINRPSEHKSSAILPEELAIARADVPLYIGGPVGPENLQSLHCVPDQVEGGVQIASDLWLGGELEQLGQLALASASQFASLAMLLVGYSGWGVGQLEEEIASGAWLPAPARPAWIFRADPARTWREVIRSMGDKARGLADQPPDPSWN